MKAQSLLRRSGRRNLGPADDTTERCHLGAISAHASGGSYCSLRRAKRGTNWWPVAWSHVRRWTLCSNRLPSP